LTYADREDVRVVLDKITRAQTMDLKLFGEVDQPRALKTAADLHQYTYLIAGSVGEFWTRICFRHLNNFTEVLQNRMLDLGKRYGDGLQLINILRDASGDLRAGRCYFPADELGAAGLEASQILEQPDAFEPVAQKWRNEAKRGLEAGMEYARAIRHWRVRAATALPALIGARTLALLQAAGPRALEQKIKVPRPEVRRMITSMVLTLASPKALEEMFRRSLPRGSMTTR
jgi:farnesyl-diphosphate farnesyltransferase